jgi:hypothetical protein
MKRNMLLIGIVGLLIVLTTVSVWGQGGYEYRHRNRDAQYCGYGSCAMQSMRGVQNRNYNLNTVESVSGEVVKVETIAGRGRSGGVHLTLKTDKENLAVNVGPQWYLNDKNVTFKEGDKIKVRGSRITLSDKATLIADKITHNDLVLNLRNSDGIPVWSRRNRSN